MPYGRCNPLPKLSMGNDRYLNQQLSPHSRPLDMFSTKASDPLPGNWNYDSAIDLFSLTPVDMDPVSFDFADSLTSADTKDFFMDPFGTPSAINGFVMPTAEDAVSPSSDFDSDDQSWTGIRQSVDLSMPEASITEKPSKVTTRSSTQNSSPTRWSSSPEIKPQEYKVPRAEKASVSASASTSTSTRKTRSLSQESNRSSTGQDPHVRNAAKRAAHNIIEKRYRTNMNAKFLALEKAISPAGVPKQTSRAGAGSLKKSEILSNALAYIESVQQENQSMHKELAMLKQNMIPGAMWRHKQSRV
ncbi:uncharacterized protein N7483_012637 [Penicillium malachiteum]|uniref:uncharacterized protein n=1 Tax=Penicillium malachiteum TaxID=1324776 RepID=UPI0025489527|nr:uncharacterized protein N7483_012637 [Penicillium malachiteum]KAJ5715456.1 hypothetical protein N7483_012637 [Penicillium malachiteum]